MRPSRAILASVDSTSAVSRASEGGGLVYFARELATGRVLGLQLEPGPEATVLMTATQFAAHAQMYQAVSAQAAAIHQQFVDVLAVSSGSYAATEAANAASAR